jgi:hypothetical protein
MKLKHDGIYVGDDQIEIIHENKYLGVDFYFHGYFEPARLERQ